MPRVADLKRTHRVRGARLTLQPRWAPRRPAVKVPGTEAARPPAPALHAGPSSHARPRQPASVRRGVSESPRSLSWGKSATEGLRVGQLDLHCRATPGVAGALPASCAAAKTGHQDPRVWTLTRNSEREAFFFPLVFGPYFIPTVLPLLPKLALSKEKKGTYFMLPQWRKEKKKKRKRKEKEKKRKRKEKEKRREEEKKRKENAGAARSASVSGVSSAGGRGQLSRRFVLARHGTVPWARPGRPGPPKKGDESRMSQ